MKLLCPTDFSTTSVTACTWAAQFLEMLGGGEMTLLYCINVVSRADDFMKLDDILRQQAEEDIQELSDRITKAVPGTKIVTRVVRSDPKSFLANALNRHDFDYVVLGTNGLTAVKDITIGSVTAYLMDRTSSPLVVIPEDTEFRPPAKVMLAVDNSPNEDGLLQPLVKILESAQAELHVVHRTLFNNIVDDFNPFANSPKDYPYTFHPIQTEEAPHLTIAKFAREQDIDLMTMVHRRREWLSRLFLSSTTKDELFVIEKPLLILPR